MTEVLVFPGDDLVVFDHLAAYGAAAIADAAGYSDMRIRWTDALEPHLELSGVSWPDLADAVHRHATARAEPSSWVSADGITGEGVSGLFSPRVKGMSDEANARWYSDRSAAVDRLHDEWAALDLAMIGALGAPSYWSRDNGDARPDYGASRWEMKTRNRGEDFVRNRLRLLARSVSSRTTDAVEAGLRGLTVVDEVGKGEAGSRTSTGLMPPTPTDNARAWCALWGISQFAVTARPTGASHTVGHAGHHLGGFFYLPAMARPWPLSRLRTVLRSRQLRAVATEGLGLRADADISTADLATAWAWLVDRGAICVVRFSVHRSDNLSAPEKWAERGERLTPGRYR